VAGSGDRAGFKASETTLQIGELIELAGKPWKRRSVAQFEAKLSGWDYEAQRLAAITGVTEAFLAVLAAQERVSLLEKTVELAEKVLQAVANRVAAGRESPIERTKASVSHFRSPFQGGRGTGRSQCPDRGERTSLPDRCQAKIRGRFGQTRRGFGTPGFAPTQGAPQRQSECSPGRL